MTIKKYTYAVGLAAILASPVYAQEIRFMCSSDGNECETFDDILTRFEADNPGVDVVVDTVAYKAIQENLPLQLAAGDGAPDIARVTDLGGLSEYYLDLSPYVDNAYWEENFGGTLPWYRPGGEGDGIFGLHAEFTITGAFINRTLFDQAGIEVPGESATWQEWAEASRAVAEATGARFPMAMDRSGHRIAGPAISYGAKLFDEDGNAVLVDDGFKGFVEQFVEWNQDGTMARDVWAGLGGSSYQDASQEFVNGDLVYYFSGSWQTNRFENDIGDIFDWEVVGAPCGDGGCTGMPGGGGLVGFQQTEHPELVAKVLDFLAQEEVYAELTARTQAIPAHAGVAAAGVTYDGVSDQAAAALNGWGAQVAKISPVAYAYQGYEHNRGMFNISVQRVTQAIVGELTVDEAMDRAAEDVRAMLDEVQ